MAEITIMGSITPDGRHFKAVLTPEYSEFLKQNKGCRVIMTVTAAASGGSFFQITYWRKAVLPALQKGFRETGDDMTLAETNERVLDLCPATENKDPDEMLTKEQWTQLIDWGIRFCAENFAIVVPEPGAED